MKYTIGLTKITIRLTDGQMETLAKTEEMINELAELKRDGIDINIPESQAKCIKDLFNSLIDFISIDYE